MKNFRVGALALFLLSPLSASAACLDLTGRYEKTDAAGAVAHLDVAQAGCERVVFREDAKEAVAEADGVCRDQATDDPAVEACTYHRFVGTALLETVLLINRSPWSANPFVGARVRHALLDGNLVAESQYYDAQGNVIDESVETWLRR
jgi:hypothetical protein